MEEPKVKLKKALRKPYVNKVSPPSGSKPTYCIVATPHERAYDAEFAKRFHRPKSTVWHTGHNIVEALLAGERSIDVIAAMLPISRNPKDWVQVNPYQPVGPFKPSIKNAED